MKKWILVAAIVFPIMVMAQLQNVFQSKIDSIYTAHKDAVGVIVHIEAPAKKISLSYAQGISDIKTNKLLDSQQPVLIASNTKPYVAVAVLRLVEQNMIDLDQPIKKVLSKTTCKLFEDKGYNLTKITVRQLLSHTSGIVDYVNDSYFEFIDTHKDYKWIKEEQIKRALQEGSPQPSGQKFSYGDINYLLLTEIIEEKTNKPFYIAMRELLRYNELGLKDTWFINLEAYPKGVLPLAHQYADQYKWDSYDLDPSWDLYGGGGIAATAKDSALFFQYLFNGKIIKDKKLLEEMYTYVLPSDQSKYCLGIYHFNLGFNAYYHGGWWGTDVIYSPEADATVTVFTLKKEFQHIINPFLGKTFLSLLLP